MYELWDVSKQEYEGSFLDTAADQDEMLERAREFIQRGRVVSDDLTIYWYDKTEKERWFVATGSDLEVWLEEYEHLRVELNRRGMSDIKLYDILSSAYEIDITVAEDLEKGTIDPMKYTARISKSVVSEIGSGSTVNEALMRAFVIHHLP